MPNLSKSRQSTSLDALLKTMAILRDSKEGCLWDLEQTHASLRRTLLEETYEALEAMDSANIADMVEELGDLLIQVVFHAQIGADEGTFTIDDVARGANEKLRRRHPHVFGDAQVSSSDEVKQQWDAIKADERRAKGQADRSLLSGVPKTMPALAYAQAVQSRAAREGVGGPPVRAVAEQVAHLENTSSKGREWKFGELLFSIVDAARLEGFEAEEVLRAANSRFYETVVKISTANTPSAEVQQG